jgi:preprotein translocase subunit Sec61beta
VRSASFYLGLVVVILAVPVSARFAKLLLGTTPFLLLALAFLVSYVALAAKVFADHAPVSVFLTADKQAKLMLVATLFLGPARLPAWRRRLVLSYMAGWVLFISVSLFLLFTGQLRATEMSRGVRISLLGMNENGLSIFAAAGLILVFTEMNVNRSSIASVLGIGAIIGGTVIFLLGVSRTGLAGFAGGLTVAIFCLVLGEAKRVGRTIIRVASRGLVPGLITMLLVLQTQNLSSTMVAWEGRLESAADGTDRGYREELNEQTLRLALDNPMGVGQDQAITFLGGVDPHNGYLKLFAEGGFLALGILLIGLTLVMALCLKLGRDRANAGILGAFAMLSITASAGQDINNINYWFFLALICAADVRLAPIGRKAFNYTTVTPEASTQ